MNRIHNIALGEWKKMYLKVLPPSSDALGRRIVEVRKYAQHTGRYQELAKLERQYVETFGLLQFVRLFDWFSLSPDSQSV